MGGRGGSGGFASASDEQKRKISNITRVLSERRFVVGKPSFEIRKDGVVEYKYIEKQNFQKVHGGMQSPDKNDVVERTTVFSGVILRDGLIKRNKNQKEEKLIKRGRK